MLRVPALRTRCALLCEVRWLSVLRVPHVSTLSTCFVLHARVRSATAESSSPPYSIRGVVFRRGVRRGPGNFAGDPSVPSHQAHGAPPGQGPLHRTPACPRTYDKTATQRRADAAPTRRPRTRTPVSTRAATQGLKLMMGVSLLISFTGPQSPLFDMARAAGTRCMHARGHAHARVGEYTHTGMPSPHETHTVLMLKSKARSRMFAHTRARRSPRAFVHPSSSP